MTTKFLVLFAVFGLLATACSGSNDGGDGVATLESTIAQSVEVSDEPVADDVDAEQAMLDFAACLRENGVDIEDPTVDADGNLQFGGFRPGQGGESGDGSGDVDRDAVQEAMQACGDLIEGVTLGFGGRGDFDMTEMQDTLIEYAACMRENGYAMDDPDFSASEPGGGGGAGGGAFGEINPDDPDFVAAQEVCQSILGDTFLGGGGGQAPGGVPETPEGSDQ
jgi:hypothetical protein